MSGEDYTPGAPDFIVCKIDYCQAMKYFKTREIIFCTIVAKLSWKKRNANIDYQNLSRIFCHSKNRD